MYKRVCFQFKENGREREKKRLWSHKELQMQESCLEEILTLEKLGERIYWNGFKDEGFQP